MKNNLNLIIGDNLELVNFYLSEIMNKIGYEEEKKIEYDMSVSSLSDILDEASMISLFSNEKIIIGNDFNISNIKDEEIDYLDRYIKNINKDVYIILIASKIDTRLKNYRIFKDNFNVIDISKSKNDDNIYDFIKNYIKDNGYKIDKYNLDYLVSKLGSDINNIKLELSKIFMYKDDDKIIDRDTIDLLVADNIDNVIYEFTNAVLDRDYDKVSKMYDNFKIQNIGYDYLLVSLSNSFRQALIIKILYNKGKSNFEIAKIINKKEFYVKKMLERLYNYTEEDICMIINKLATIDREFKTGKNNIDMLELFLIGK
ncbi:MAG: DNA polymerase III subunit delta [Bacilli bacterium]